MRNINLLIVISGTIRIANTNIKCHVGYHYGGMDYKKIDSVLCDSSSIAPSGCYIEKNDLGLAYGCAYKDFLEEVGLKEMDYGNTVLDDDKGFNLDYCKEQNCNKPNGEATTTANPITETTTTPEQDDQEKMG